MERLNTSCSLAPTRMPPSRGPLAASKAAGRFRIEPGSTLHLAGDSDLTVDIVQGRVWLTSAGDIHDHFPGAGTRLDFAVGSDLMIEAHGGPAEVCLTPRLCGGAAADGVGHGLGFALPGRPLVGLTSVASRTVHAFAPLRAPSSRTDDRTDDQVDDESAPAGESRPADRGARGGLGDWARAIIAAWRRRWAEARTRRLINTLDSGQLRDIGAPAHLILYRERLEREERLWQRAMFGGGNRADLD